MTEGEVAFIDLYERFYRPVYAYCRRRTTGDAVDDVVAETFLIAWRKIDQVPPSSEGLLWLYGVAYRVIGHQWRTHSRRESLNQKLKGMGQAPQEIPEELLVVRHESRQVLEALSNLKPTDKEILLLSAWESLPQADIAVALNISIGAVRQRLHQAKRNLAKQYERLDRSGDRTAAPTSGGVA